MSREGGPFKIDSILGGTGTRGRYQRTALGNAVRYATVVNLLKEDADREQRGEERNIRSRSDLIDALGVTSQDIRKEYNQAVNSRNLAPESRTAQMAMGETTFRTKLGRTISRETAFNASRSFNINTTPTEFSTSSSAKQFFGSFVKGDDDYFGSKVLYENVFGPNIEQGHTNRLSQEYNVTPDDIDSDYGITASQKVLEGIVRRSVDNADNAVRRLDLEFTRYHGDSLVDQYSLTGSGLRSSRDTITRVQATGTAAEKNRLFGSATSTEEFGSPANQIEKMATNKMISDSLDEINTLYTNRSSGAPSQEVVNKGGVQTFVEIFNSSKNNISIQTYQFQNDTISAALTDVIKRRVLERVVTGDRGNPFTVDFTVAMPTNRNNQLIRNDVNTDDPKGKYAIGETSLSIQGPNLIEVMKLKALQEEVAEFLKEEVDIAEDDISKFFKLNIQYRDRKYHPKLYMSDTMAAIGTQNLTGPVGNSVNQAGSNFEQMYIVRNKYQDDKELNKNRLQARAAREYVKSEWSDKRALQESLMKNADVRASLLYRQIKQLSDAERAYADAGYEGYGLHNRKGQVGLSGDIYAHLRDTLNFISTYYGRQNNKTVNLAQDVKAGGGKFNMYFVLDQAFLLQSGTIGINKQVKGEMGADFDNNLYTQERDHKLSHYKDMQAKTAFLLTVGQAQVVVDAKNYKEQVYDPIVKKIEENEKLKAKFNKYGRNLGLVAGNAIFGPKTVGGYDKAVENMISYMRMQGFDEKSFSREDLINIIAIGSGNITMSTAPRQHVKSAALFENVDGTQTMRSFYMGSSNMGMYSLGIPGGRDPKGLPTKEDFSVVNTEMGVLLGTEVSGNGTTADLRRVRRFDNRPSTVDVDIHTAERAMNLGDENYSLDYEEERDELVLMQERFVQTYKELGNSRITHPGYQEVKTTPLWQESVNTGNLLVLKSRLESMRDQMGLSESAFKIVERLEGNKLVSYNVTLNMAAALGEKGFMSASANLPKFNFEISVLHGPSRGRGDAAERTGGVPGFVYFVDKNKVVGNAIFSNDSGRDIELYGRYNYDDTFASGEYESDSAFEQRLKEQGGHLTKSQLEAARAQHKRDAANFAKQGRVRLRTGESAHLSSLDVVPQMFGSMISEGLERMAVRKPLETWAGIQATGQETDVITEYLAKSLFGTGRHIEKAEQAGSYIHREVSARELLKRELGSLTLNEFGGKISTMIYGDAGGSGLLRDLMQQAQNQYGLNLDFSQTKKDSAYNILVKTIHAYSNAVDKSYSNESDFRVEQEKALDSVLGAFRNLVHSSPELINEIVKYGYTDTDLTRDVSAYKNYVNSLFDPFLQAREERTYGGQQGFDRTVMLGLVGSGVDKRTARMMQELDVEDSGIHNVLAYNRFTGLAYNTTTDIHAYVYRSIASKSTSMATGNEDLDSSVLGQEARQIGDASNLRGLEAIGIGTISKAEYYIKDNAGNLELSSSLNAMLGIKEGEPISQVQAAVRDKLLKSYRHSFSVDQNNRAQTENLLTFYTGGKLAQLPQRIKNAMGARPLMQYSLAAQKATEGSYAEGEKAYSIDSLSQEYIKDNRSQLDALIEKRKQKLLAGRTPEQLKGTKDAEKDIELLEKLGYMTPDMFNTTNYGLGAVFKGSIKRILSQDQLAHVEAKRAQLKELFGEGENEDETGLLEELLRVEILKDSLSNQGLGMMIAGNERFKYTMAFIQLNGLYTDTFLANPLYGTMYSDQEKYYSLRDSGAMVGGVQDEMLRTGDVLNRGMREGYFETQTKSVKGSMIGEGGMQFLLQRGDRVVELTDKGNAMHGGASTGKFYVERQDAEGNYKPVTYDDKVYLEFRTGETQILPAEKVTAEMRKAARVVEHIPGEVVTLDDKRNVVSIGNVIDNTSYSPVGTPTLGSAKLTNYGRVGEASEDYIFEMSMRQGNFSNNEYVQQIHRLRSKKPGGGSRVEGTNSSALIKGVANFAADTKVNIEGREVRMNMFQHLEKQVEDFEKSQAVGGSLAFMVQNMNEKQGREFALHSGEGYAPLSSMVHGLYNVNNFKSFFWSHGAAILTDAPGRGHVHTPGSKAPLTLLDNLMQGRGGTDAEKIAAAKKMMGGLIMAFGDDFLTVDNASGASVEKGNKNIKQLRRSLIEGMQRGEYGETYRAMVNAQTLLLHSSGRLDAFTQNNARESYQDKLYDMLYDSIKTKGVFNDLNLGGLGLITAEEAMAVMSAEAGKSDVGASEAVLGKIENLLSSAAKKAQRNGGSLTLGGADGFMNRQAAHVATAIDLFQQMSVQNKSYRIPSELADNDRVRQIMMGVMGVGNLEKEQEQELMEILEGAATQINMVSIFTDITFSQSKDPVSTQTVGRHEGQHLITPYLGDILQYQKGGQIEKMQHTMASLLALTTGAKSSALVYGSQVQAMNVNQGLAFDLRATPGDLKNRDADYIFSPFMSRRFLGFYQGGAMSAYTKDYIAEYKAITQSLIQGPKYTKDEYGDPVLDPKSLFTNSGALTEAGKQDVVDFVSRIKGLQGDAAQTEIMRLSHLSYNDYAAEKLEAIEDELAAINNKFQANPKKAIGSVTKEYLSSMSNNTMFFSMPKITFDYQSGGIVARTSDIDIYTFLPSASIMRELGTQHQDFIDPIMNNYKALAELFTPGTLAYRAYEKIRAGSGDASLNAVLLSNDEAKALEGVLSAAASMPREIEQALGSQRLQQAMGGKTKYQGFTSIGIGSLLLPGGSVVLPKAKLEEAQMGEADQRKVALMREMEAEAERLTVKAPTSNLDNYEQALHKLAKGNSDLYNALNSTLSIVNDEGKKVLLPEGRGIISAYKNFHKLRKASVYAREFGISTDKQLTTVARSLNQLTYIHDQLNSLIAANPKDTKKLESLTELRTKIESLKHDTLKAIDQRFTSKQKLDLVSEFIEKTGVEGQYKYAVSYMTETEGLYDLDKKIYRKRKAFFGDITSAMEFATGQNFDKVVKLQDMQSNVPRSELTNELTKEIQSELLKQHDVQFDNQKQINDFYKAQYKEYITPYIQDPTFESRVSLEPKPKFLRESNEFSERDDITFLRMMQSQSVQMIQRGFDNTYKENYSKIKSEAAQLKSKMGQLYAALARADETKAVQMYNSMQSALDAALENIKSMAKHSPSSMDRYIYTMAEANVKGLQAQLFAKKHEITKDASTEAKKFTELHQRRAARFQRTQVLLNPTDQDGLGLFSGLGQKQSEISILDFEQPMRGDITSSAIMGSNKEILIVEKLKSFDKMYKNKQISLEGRQSGKKNMAQTYLNDMIKQYKAQSERIKSLSRNKSVANQYKEPNEGGVSDRAVDAQLLAAHEEQENRLTSLIEELENVKAGISNEADPNYQVTFNKVQRLVTEFDTTNADAVEFFRSPTPGGTDHRLLTYRAMQGVSAFNRVVDTMNQELGVGQSEKLMLDETRNSTATYIGSIGLITYGGGDFDGDPYTTLFNKAGDLNAQIVNKKLDINLDQQRIKALRQQKKRLKDEGANLQQIEDIDISIKQYANNLGNKVREKDHILEKYRDYGRYAAYDINTRARKQVARFLGVDEEYFISAEGEDEYIVQKNNDGTESYVKSGKKIYGYANQTYQADALHALLNTGYGLYDSVANQGSMMSTLYRNVDAIVNFAGQRADSREGLTFLKQLDEGLKTNNTDEGRATARGSLRERIEQRKKELDSLNRRNSVEQDQYDFLKSMVKASDEELDSMVSILRQANEERERYFAAEGQIDILNTNTEVADHKRQAFMREFIGGRLYNAVEQQGKLQKLMKLGSNDTDVNEPMFDLLSKTLGKAGGEILGKAYNTIIGTTFQDAPVISIGRALEVEGSTFYKATLKAYKKEVLEKDQVAMDDIYQEVQTRLGRSKTSGEDKAFDAEREKVIQEKTLEYVSATKRSMDRSERVQGFMKNIHQILRDSIKLKGSGEEQKQTLVNSSNRYNELTSEIKRINDEIETLSDKAKINELEEQRDKAIEDRAGIIESISSGLGPGSGLKSLISLDTLINKSIEGGLGQKDFNKVMGSTIDSNASIFYMDKLGISKEDQETIKTTVGDVPSAQLAKIARFKTARDVTSMVASYRFANRIEQGMGDSAGISKVKELALIHKRKLTVEAEASKSQGKTFDEHSARTKAMHDVKLGNVSSGGGVKDPKNSVSDIISNRYLTNSDAYSAGTINDSAYREALAMHLGMDMDKFYTAENEEGRSILDIEIDKGKAGDLKDFTGLKEVGQGQQLTLRSFMDERNTELETYLLMFDANYRDSAETTSSIFGPDGSRLEGLAAMEKFRKGLATSMAGNESAFEEFKNPAAHNLFKSLDTEMITTMGQLVAQNKLGASSADAFTMMYTGVASALLESTGGGFTVTRKEEKLTEDEKRRAVKVGSDKFEVEVSFEDMTDEEKKFETHRAIAGALAGTDPQASVTRHTSEESKQTAAIHARLVQDDEYLRSYIDTMEGTLEAQERGMLKEMGDSLLLKMVEEGGEKLDAALDALIPGADDARHSASGGVDSTREKQKDRVRQYVTRRKSIILGQEHRRQSTAREQMLKSNPVLKRGSFFNQLNTGTANLLSSNKVSTGLDLLAPLALTALGSAISEGSIDSDAIQRLGGMAISSFQYARAGMVDDKDDTELRNRQNVVRGLTGVYKLRSAMNRHEGDYGAALAEVAVREGTQQVVQSLVTPKLNRAIAHKVFGADQPPGIMALGMDKYMASQQMAGNIGSSIISAATSAVMSGVIMRNVVESPKRQAAEVIQSFQPAADYTAAANAEIARRRAQEAAYENMLVVETGDTEQLISDYKVDTDSTYSYYNQSAREDMADAIEIEPDTMGELTAGLIA